MSQIGKGKHANEVAQEVPQELSLEGPRLILKPLQVKEAHQLRELLTGPATMQYLKSIQKSPADWTLEDARKHIHNKIELQERNMQLNFNVYIKDSGSSGNKEGCHDMRFVGSAGLPTLELYNHSATVGIIISHQGAGSNYGTECLYLILKYAFETMNLHRVAFETIKDNLPMRGWLEKVALVCLESVLKEALFSENHYIDLYIYPVFADHWWSVTKSALEKRLGIN